MGYEDWWEPYRLKKMSNYYHMFCTPNTVWAKGGVNPRCRYDFQFRVWNVRGHAYYMQRLWKGKHYGFR